MLELSFRKSVELLTGHLTEVSAIENLTTHGSVISTSNSTTVKRIFTDPRDNMGVTLPERSHDSQSSTYLGLEPLLSESSPTCSTWPTLDPLEVALLDTEIEMDLEEESLHDYLLDQDVGSVTLGDMSRPPVLNRSPYKQMPNSSDSEIGQSQPLLIFIRTAINCEEGELSRIDSPLSQAPSSTPVSCPTSCDTTYRHR